VFSDLAGSTSLGERLDPESLSRLMARWFERTRAVLERHGGTVQKFIGDAVMAVFGIPTVREEDALRAVRAAAELRVALAGLNQELAGEWGETLRLRTGVNTGEVLLGETTWRLVRDAVTVTPLPPLTIKGKGARVAAYRLDSVNPPSSGWSSPPPTGCCSTPTAWSRRATVRGGRSRWTTRRRPSCSPRRRSTRPSTGWSPASCGTPAAAWTTTWRSS